MRVFVALGSVLLIAAALIVVTADDASWVGRVRARAAGQAWPRFLLALFTGELIYVAVYGKDPPSDDPAACAADEDADVDADAAAADGGDDAGVGGGAQSGGELDGRAEEAAVKQRSVGGGDGAEQLQADAATDDGASRGTVAAAAAEAEAAR